MKTFVLGFLIISVALVLTFSLPCYAQIETERFLTPEGTAWKIKTGSPETALHLGFLSNYIWFCDGSTCIEFDDAQYKNRPITKFNASNCSDDPPPRIGYTMSGYVIPFLRFGKIEVCATSSLGKVCFDYPLIRDDNFTYIP